MLCALCQAFPREQFCPATTVIWLWDHLPFTSFSSEGLVLQIFLILKKMWCVPWTFCRGKTFFPSKVQWFKLTRQFLSVGGQCVNEKQPHIHYTRGFSHWSNTLETLHVIFWAPQHLVSMNCFSCRREEVWSPVSCRTPKSAWPLGSSGSPVQYSRGNGELQTLSICLAFCHS